MERSYRLLKREKIDTIAIHCQSQIDNFLTHFFVIGKFLTVYFLFGKMLSLLWQIWYIIGLIFIVANGQILKNNLTIYPGSNIQREKEKLKDEMKTA